MARKQPARTRPVTRKSPASTAPPPAEEPIPDEDAVQEPPSTSGKAPARSRSARKRKISEVSPQADVEPVAEIPARERSLSLSSIHFDDDEDDDEVEERKAVVLTDNEGARTLPSSSLLRIAKANSLSPSPVRTPPVPSLASLPPQKKKKRIATPRTNYSDYFVPDVSSPLFLSCTLCNQKIKYLFGNKKINSGLRSHLEREHPETNVDTVEKEKNHDEARSWFLRGLATSHSPFLLANNFEIRKAFQCLDNSFDLGDRRIYSGRLLEAEYETALKNLRTSLEGQSVSLTLDHWSSKDQVHSLMGCTASFIDDKWRRQNLVINIGEVDNGVHNSDQIKDYLGELQADLPIGEVTCAVTDSARVMSAGARKADVERIPCLLHALHLVVIHSFDRFPAIVKDLSIENSWEPGRRILKKLRSLVDHLHRSRKSWTAHAKLLEEGGKRVIRIPLEVRVRWGSLLAMLRVSSEQHPQLSTTARETKHEALSDLESLQLEKLVEVLSHADEVSRELSKADATASLIIPLLFGLRQSIAECKNDGGCINEYVDKLMEEFTKRLDPYVHNPILQKAMILDPRFCHWNHLLSSGEREEAIRSLASESKKTTATPGNSGNNAVPAAPVTSSSINKLLARIQPRKQVSASMSSTFREEWTFFVSVAESVSIADPLAFFLTHHPKLPLLSALARRYLAIPPSSIDSERLFSQLGLIVGDKQRNRICSTSMKKLVFVAASCRANRIRFDDSAEWNRYYSNDTEYYEDEENALGI